MLKLRVVTNLCNIQRSISFFNVIRQNDGYINVYLGFIMIMLAKLTIGEIGKENSMLIWVRNRKSPAEDGANVPPNRSIIMFVASWDSF
jgi:hypothetical protein